MCPDEDEQQEQQQSDDFDQIEEPQEQQEQQEQQGDDQDVFSVGDDSNADKGDASFESQDSDKQVEDKQVASEAYNIPEGWVIQDEDLTSFNNVVGSIEIVDGKITHDGRQTLIDLFVGVEGGRLSTSVQEAEESIQEAKSEWKQSLRDHKELGGANIKATNINLSHLSRTMPPETFKYLKDSGLIFNPSLVPWFNSLGKSLREAPVNFGHSGGEGDSKTPAQSMFAKSGHV